MTHEEKQLKLEKYKTLLFLILGYQLRFYTGSMVFDDWDPSADYYLQQKQQTAKDVEERNLDALQERLNRLLKNVEMRGDLNFEGYIKDHTGYELDNVRNSGPDAAEVKHVVVQIQPPPPSDGSTVTTDITTTSRSLTQEEYAEFRRENGLLSETYAPDGIRRVMTHTNGIGENAITLVIIGMMGGSGGVYSAMGASLPIKAYWKDDHTVVIETKEEYSVLTKHHTVRSFDDLVKIEYMEGL